jgi:hypothetical protein
MRNGLLILLLLPVACFSQKKETSKKKLNLHTITSIGVAGGEKETAPVAQVSAGISYGPWFSGLGVGFDYYRYNSVPVFADWRFNFGPKRVLFLYINGGYHFATGGGKEVTENPFVTKDRLRGGLFGDGGFGFNISAGRSNRFGLSMGFRYKAMVHTFSYTTGCLGCEMQYRDHYGFNTIVSKLSWEFGQ